MTVADWRCLCGRTNPADSDRCFACETPRKVGEEYDPRAALWRPVRSLLADSDGIESKVGPAVGWLLVGVVMALVPRGMVHFGVDLIAPSWALGLMALIGQFCTCAGLGYLISGSRRDLKRVRGYIVALVAQVILLAWFVLREASQAGGYLDFLAGDALLQAIVGMSLLLLEALVFVPAVLSTGRLTRQAGYGESGVVSILLIGAFLAMKLVLEAGLGRADDTAIERLLQTYLEIARPNFIELVQQSLMVLLIARIWLVRGGGLFYTADLHYWLIGLVLVGGATFAVLRFGVEERRVAMMDEVSAVSSANTHNCPLMGDQLETLLAGRRDLLSLVAEVRAAKDPRRLAYTKEVLWEVGDVERRREGDSMARLARCGKNPRVAVAIKKLSQ